MSLSAQHNLDKLNADLTTYAEVTKKTPKEALIKQAGKIGFLLSQKLQRIKPGKGAIRSERLAALKSGQGVHVRESVREEIAAKYGARQEIGTRRTIFGKRGRGTNNRGLNLEALMVQRELNLRESGRGFTAFSTRYSGLAQFLSASNNSSRSWLDRYNRFLAAAGIIAAADDTTLTLSWGGGPSSDSAARGLTKPAAQELIAEAIDEVRADMNTYVGEVLNENWRRAFGI